MTPGHAITPLLAEFSDKGMERAFQAAHLGDTRRQIGALLVVYALVDALFLITDFRFLGQSYLYTAMAARTAILAISLITLWSLSRDRHDARAVTIRLTAWQWANGLAVAALVTPRDDIALALTFLIPIIHLLCVPVPVRVAVINGFGTSAVILAGYLLPAPWTQTNLGLIVVMVMANAMTLLVVIRDNLRVRQAWAAMESERAANRELAANRALLERTFTAVPVPLIVSHAADGRIERHNEATGAFFGGELAAYGIKSTVQLYADPSQRAALLVELTERGHIAGYEARMKVADGTERHVLISATSVEVEGDPFLVAGFVDITTRKTLESHLAFLASSDPLTGIANRHRFFSAAERELGRARRHGHDTAVLVIDVDHFKRINDTHGHETGDVALQTFAEACGATVRTGDLLARMGGEEFAVLLPETGTESARQMAERLRAAAHGMKLIASGAPLSITVSIGVAVAHPDDRGIGPALSRADKAMYRAKHAGRDRVVMDGEDDGHAVARAGS